MSKVTPKQKFDLMLTGIFFLFVYLYIWLRIQPELLFFNIGIITGPTFFRTGVLFFKQHLFYSGGPAEYLTALLSQSYYYSSLGAAVITLTAFLFFMATKSVAKQISKTVPAFLCCLPALVVLILGCQYQNPLITTVPLLISLWFSILFFNISSKRTPLRLVQFIVMSAALYYLSGGVSVVFALLATVYTLTIKRKFLLSISYMLAWPIIVYIIGVGIFQQPLNDAMLCLTPFNWRFGRYPKNVLGTQTLMAVCALYLYYPLVITLLLPVSKLFSNKIRNTKFTSLLSAVLLGTLCFLSIHFMFYRKGKDHCKLVYFYRHHKWDQLIEYTRTIPANHYNRLYYYFLNRALHSNGRLLDEMFSYRQRMDNLLITGTKRVMPPHPSQELLECDLFVKLGLVNLAEKKAYEVLERSNESPLAMENLVNIYLARGNFENARVILNVLSRDLVYRKRSQQLLKLIEEDKISQIEEISEIRLVMSTIDCHHFDNKIEQLMLNLLESNPYNRGALEYLAANCLVNGQLKKIVGVVGRFKDAGYAQLPRHIQEAILLNEEIYRKKPDIKGYSIKPEARHRFNKFKLIVQSTDKATIKQKLLPHFGDTYYFYYYFPKNH